MNRASFASIGLLAVALVSGVAFDGAPPRRVVTRAGYRVLEADFHVHTRFSDGFLSPFDVVLHAKRNGLDAFAVTEHNIVYPAKMARWFSRSIGGPTVIIGEEITTDRFHLIALGMEQRISPYGELGPILDRVHEAGGIAIAAHPVKHFWPAFESEIAKLDGAEVMHPIALTASRGPRRGAWLWEEMRDFSLRAREGPYRLTAIGSSDYHFFNGLGVMRTFVFARDASEDAVLEALKQKRTVVRDLAGNLYGDEELVAEMKAHPIAEGEQEENGAERGYEPKGPLDRVGRVAGWLGMLGLILFSARRRARQSS
jgi:hypothetical protein